MYEINTDLLCTCFPFMYLFLLIITYIIPQYVLHFFWTVVFRSLKDTDICLKALLKELQLYMLCTNITSIHITYIYIFFLHVQIKDFHLSGTHIVIVWLSEKDYINVESIYITISILNKQNGKLYIVIIIVLTMTENYCRSRIYVFHT